MARIIKVPTHRWLKTNRARRIGTVIIALIILALIAVASYAGYAYVQAEQARKARDAQQAIETAYKQRYQEAIDVNKVAAVAQTKAANGDIAGATQDMLAAVNNPATTKDARIMLYELLAYTLLNSSKYDDAATYAAKAEDLAKDRKSAKVLGDIALQKGDKPLAAKWYQTAIDRFSANEKSQMPELYTEYMQALAEAKK